MVPKVLRDSFLDVYHSLHPGQLGMVAATKDEVWWPRFHRDVVERCSKCKACTAIGKNLKTIIPKNKFTPLPKCSEPNEEIQLDFSGAINDEKGNEKYLLVAVDRFSKFVTIACTKSTTTKTLMKFVRQYVNLHGVPRRIRADQGSCFISKIFEDWCEDKNIEFIKAPVDDHRAIGLVERTIQTIRNRLACLKVEKGADFKLKSEVEELTYHMRNTI